MRVYEVDLLIAFDHEFCKMGRSAKEAQSSFVRHLTLLLWSVHLSAHGHRFRALALVSAAARSEEG